jgi:16S rRNA (cytosine1402-N4)-methyltransferase
MVPHLPVMEEEVLKMLNIKRGGVYIDATIGLGGHTRAILNAVGEEGRVVGIDKDEDALGVVKRRIADKRLLMKMGSFSDIKSLLKNSHIFKVDGILFDLGVSMLQLKNYGRGFSFYSKERLDMRMDKSQHFTAWDVVNKYPKDKLEKILSEYGEEPKAKKIAHAIVDYRSKKTIDTCDELAMIVEKVYGYRGRIHPATRTFQAIRIEVNKELEELKKGLDSALKVLTKGGRLCVITYHSLEDRIVKNFMREGSKESLLKIITKKPIVPTSEEINKNPSARGAKLRVAEKL